MRDLQFEKGRSEHLLENILPKSIIDALKGREETSSETLRSPVVAHRIDQASVLFADLVGFTAFSGTQEAEFVVEQLNYIVHVFDQVTEKFGVDDWRLLHDGGRRSQ